MKSGFLTITTCSLALALAACGGSSSSGNNPKSSSSTPATSAVSSAASSIETSSAAVSSAPVGSSSLAPSSVSSSNSVATSSSNSSAPAAQTGVFVDSAVAGIQYQTSPGGFTGVTSVDGHYQFAEGDRVVFSLGDMKFPEVPAKGVVTPVDIAQAADPANAERIKTNIAALLQSLDTDGNPDNGISINTETAATVAAEVNFNQPYAAFAASAAVTNLVANSGSATTNLVSETAALAHLEQSLKKLLVGTWYVKGDTYEYALFIIDGQRYVTIDYDSAEVNGAALETGSYRWDQTTGKVTLSSVTRTDSALDTNAPMANGNLLKLNGNVLTLTAGDETFTLNRLMPTEQSPLQGGWVIPDTDITVAFAFTGTHYLMGQMGTKNDEGIVLDGDEVGQSGIELGTYTYDSNTHAIKVGTQVDTNGQWGMSHPCAVLSDEQHKNYEESNFLNCGLNGSEIVQTFTVTGDMATFVSEADTIANGGEEDETRFERINELPDGDVHLKLELTLTLTGYTQGELFTDTGATMQCDLFSQPELGEQEVVHERWVLGSNPNRPTWVSVESATYNPETRKITISHQEEFAPIPGHPGFLHAWDDMVDLTYQPGKEHVIQGTVTEVNRLTWERNTNQVSTCTSVWSVVGKLR